MLSRSLFAGSPNKVVRGERDSGAAPTGAAPPPTPRLDDLKHGADKRIELGTEGVLSFDE